MDDSKYNDFSLANTMDNIVRQEHVQEISSASACMPIPRGHRDTAGSDGEDQNNNRVGTGTTELGKDSHSKERFFWQYNVQTKRPKKQRLIVRARLEDPHVLNEATDPIFSPFKPNPRKLHNIGLQLDKLNHIINDMTPVSKLPFPARPKTRKKKNKLASRVRRLKRKAQYEANKIKLCGLEMEHKRLIDGISQAKHTLVAKLAESNPETQNDMTPVSKLPFPARPKKKARKKKNKLAESNPEIQKDLTQQFKKSCKLTTNMRIADHLTEFVNKVLDNVRAGIPDGGIDNF